VRLEGEQIVVDLGDRLRETLSGFPALSADAVSTLVDIALEDVWDNDAGRTGEEPSNL